MPPAGRPAPDAAGRQVVVADLEAALDRAAAAHPNPGRTTVHRLNRTEYTNAIRDLFGLEIDGRALLPGDNTDVHGFDNNADILSVLAAADGTLPVGGAEDQRLGARAGRTRPDFTQVRVHKWMKQDERMSEDAAVRLARRRRRALRVPRRRRVRRQAAAAADDERPHQGPRRRSTCSTCALDDALVKRFTVGGDEWVKLAPPENYSSNIRTGAEWEDYSHNMDRDARGPVSGEGRPPDRRRLVRRGCVVARGRHPAAGRRVAEPQRDARRQSRGRERRDQRAFRCVGRRQLGAPPGRAGVRAAATRPTKSRCARRILSRLARRAYRRPPTAPICGRCSSSTGPAGPKAASTAVSSSRSSGCWSARRSCSAPNATSPRTARAPSPISSWRRGCRSSCGAASRTTQLLDAAAKGTLREPAVLERQVRRMLADSRSHALVDNFVGAVAGGAQPS